MIKIILPIKPKYSQGLLEGRKQFELRRNIPKKNVKKILIYETAPSSKIVGILGIKKIHKLPIVELWELTKNSNLLSWVEFKDYYKDKSEGFAYEIISRKTFKKPKNIEEYNLKSAPQGFAYAN